jgi:hypothetical protein
MTTDGPQRLTGYPMRDYDVPSARAIQPQEPQNGPVVPVPTPGPSEGAQTSTGDDA